MAIVRPEHQAGISVANTGCDLTPEELPRVFERFWRKESARSQTGLHAGLGLSLCRRLMTLQGGTMQVETHGDEFHATALFPKSATL
jgi:signal transduction histidine kinase